MTLGTNGNEDLKEREKSRARLEAGIRVRQLLVMAAVVIATGLGFKGYEAAGHALASQSHTGRAILGIADPTSLPGVVPPVVVTATATRMPGIDVRGVYGQTPGPDFFGGPNILGRATVTPSIP